MPRTGLMAICGRLHLFGVRAASMTSTLHLENHPHDTGSQDQENPREHGIGQLLNTVHLLLEHVEFCFQAIEYLILQLAKPLHAGRVLDVLLYCCHYIFSFAASSVVTRASSSSNRFKRLS